MDRLVVRSILGSKSGVVSVLERAPSLSSLFLLRSFSLRRPRLLLLLLLLRRRRRCRGNCTLPRPTADAATTTPRSRCAYDHLQDACKGHGWLCDGGCDDGDGGRRCAREGSLCLRAFAGSTFR